MECLIWIFKWRHLVGKFRTNAGSVIWPKLEPMKCFTWIFFSSEFACFVAGEIIQVIEAIPGSVVPLAMFVFLNVIFAIFLRIWFVFHSNLHFLICYKSVQNLVIVWRFMSLALSHFLGMPFGHQMKPLARVEKFAIWWHHSHKSQSCPPDSATCISSKFDHQLAPIALVANLPFKWRHKEPGLF